MANKLLTVAALAVGGYLLSKQLNKPQQSGDPSSVRETIEVDVPLSTAYNQWTQFEEFPLFMESVHEVRQLDDKHLHWRADVAGKEVHWHSEITEQIPDKRIAWRSTGGPPNAGIVSFKKISDSKTAITLQMDYDPQTVTEKIGDALGFVTLQTKSNLKRFKELLESRGRETGAWRGTVAPGSGKPVLPH
ncbi:SRPBCC family protein [soil metagenome]